MPETKYTTSIYLAVHGADPDAAGKAAVRVAQDFIARLRRKAPAVKNMRLALEAPAARKGDEGVFEVWSTLKAEVPDSLSALGATNDLDAWRVILKQVFNASCAENHELVHHRSSRVGITRALRPEEEAGETAVAAPKDDKPKEMIAVKVLLGGQEYNVQIPKGENLLDGVNDKGVAVKWDCKSGVCDTCKVHVLKGMENLSAPNDAEKNMLGDLIDKGYRLCCQVTANGPVEIKQ